MLVRRDACIDDFVENSHRGDNSGVTATLLTAETMFRTVLVCKGQDRVDERVDDDGADDR